MSSTTEVTVPRTRLVGRLVPVSLDGVSSLAVVRVPSPVGLGPVSFKHLRVTRDPIFPVSLSSFKCL